MKIKVIFSSDRLPRDLARRVKKHINASGGEAKHAECLKLISHMFGYANWYALLAQVDPSNGSLPDAAVSSLEFALREKQYLGELLKVGFTEGAARELLDSVQIGGWWGLSRFAGRAA